jgi:hypothetical protein
MKQRIVHMGATLTSRKTWLGMLLKSFIEANFQEVKAIFFNWPTGQTTELWNEDYQATIQRRIHKKTP